MFALTLFVMHILIHMLAFVFQQTTTGTDPTVTAFGSSVTVAAIGVAFIQWVKKSKWFPWATMETAKLNRILSALYAVVAAVGIHLAWNHGAVPGSYMLEVTGLTVMGVAMGIWGVLKAFVLQELIYRTAANQKAPVPADVAVAASAPVAKARCSSAALPAAGGRGDGDSGVWKWLTGLCATVILMLLGMIGQLRSDMVSKADLIAALQSQQRQIDAEDSRMTRVENSLTDINTSLGEVKGALGIDGPPKRGHH